MLDKAAGMEPEALADGESIVELHRCLARLEAVTTRATAAFEAGGEWAVDGARSAAAWVSVSCGLPRAAVSRRAHLGRSLRRLPGAAQAWLAGHIGSHHVAALACARTPATEEALARDEEVLVAQAQELRYDQFARVLAYWEHHADPDGTEAAAARQRQGRRFHLSQGFHGTWVGDLELDPVSGAALANQLRRIEDELFEADWAEARARLGEGALPTDVARRPAQRRADALVEMARRAGTAPAHGRRPEPLFTVLVGYETFAGPICQLADGTVVSPGSVAGWLDEAWIERIVFDGPSRVIDVGVTRRIFEGATRRAVQAMFPECYQRFCDVPAERCQVDHVEPYAAGGLTIASNGRPACACHTRARHRRRGKPPRE